MASVRAPLSQHHAFKAIHAVDVPAPRPCLRRNTLHCGATPPLCVCSLADGHGSCSALGHCDNAIGTFAVPFCVNVFAVLLGRVAGSYNASCRSSQDLPVCGPRQLHRVPYPLSLPSRLTRASRPHLLLPLSILAPHPDPAGVNWCLTVALIS